MGNQIETENKNLCSEFSRQNSERNELRQTKVGMGWVTLWGLAVPHTSPSGPQRPPKPPFSTKGDSGLSVRRGEATAAYHRSRVGRRHVTCSTGPGRKSAVGRAVPPRRNWNRILNRIRNPDRDSQPKERGKGKGGRNLPACCTTIHCRLVVQNLHMHATYDTCQKSHLLHPGDRLLCSEHHRAPPHRADR